MATKDVRPRVAVRLCNCMHFGLHGQVGLMVYVSDCPQRWMHFGMWNALKLSLYIILAAPGQSSARDFPVITVVLFVPAHPSHGSGVCSR